MHLFFFFAFQKRKVILCCYIRALCVYSVVCSRLLTRKPSEFDDELPHAYALSLSLSALSEEDTEASRAGSVHLSIDVCN